MRARPDDARSHYNLGNFYLARSQTSEAIACFERAGAQLALRSSNEADAEALFAARRLVFPALERLGGVLGPAAIEHVPTEVGERGRQDDGERRHDRDEQDRRLASIAPTW